MGSCIIDALDDRKVITVDIPGAFLQGDWPQDKHPGYIMFKEIMADTICEINSLFNNTIIWSQDNEQKCLYSRLIKAVYKTLLGAIIFYNKLSKHLTNHRFT